MKRVCERAFWIVFIAMSFWASAVPAAHAYIDPGSGSLIAQIAVGSIVAVGLFVKTFWRRIRAALSRLFGRKPADANEVQSSEDEKVVR